jgi:TPR repeat protein
MNVFATRTSICLAFFAALSIGGSSARAVAESSSWSSQDETTIPKLAPSPKWTDPEPAPNTPAAAGIKNRMPTLVPATGDDAAYTAFDQGQYLTALKLAEEAAARGEPQANTLIGLIYGGGLGVQKDDRKADDYFKRASDMGDVQGTFALGMSYAQGRGVKKDFRTAGTLFEKAALTGNAEANYNLGLLFLNGNGKPLNPIRAFQHIRYAAEKGIPQAEYDLAELYQTGSGVDANALEAAKWLSRASEHGLAVAQYDYAVRLLQGYGLTLDEPKIPALLKAAAEKGIAGAQNRLGYVYLDGIKVKKDPIEAAKWRLIAQKSGFEDKNFDEILTKMSKGDRLKAAVEASAWMDRIAVDPEMSAVP